MIVTIDGQIDTLVATAKQTTSSGVTNITVAGAGSKGSGAGFTLVNITGTGTYNVGTVTYNGSSIQTVVMVDSYKDAAGQSANYTSPTVPGTTAVGTVTVTTLTSTSIIATFNGTLSKTSNSPASDPASSIVTNGSVNATIM